jgi:integrase
MGFIEKRSGGYRARYRDPLGRLTSKTFTRKADAERWTKEMEVAIERGDWLDPRNAQVPLATWAEEYLSLARRLSPSTQETYERDLRKYILPRFGAYRIGRLPADEIENWLNDEVAAGVAPSSVHRHYRLLRRMLQVAVQKQKLQANPCDRVEPPRVPKTEMTFLSWEQAVDLAEAHQERYRTMIYLAVDSGMRWSELIGLRRARVDLGRQGARHRADDPAEGRQVAPQGAEDAGVGPLHHHVGGDRRAAGRPRRPLRPPRPGRAGIRQHGGESADLIELLAAPLLEGAPGCWRVLSISRPQAHQRRPCHRRGRPPKGHPDQDGPLVGECDPRPLRPPLPRARRGHRHLLRRSPS